MSPEIGVQTPGLVPSIRNSFGSGLGSLILPLPGWTFSMLLTEQLCMGGHPMSFCCLEKESGYPSLFSLWDTRWSLHLCTVSVFLKEVASSERAASLGERGKDNEFTFPKCSGVIGDTKTVIKLVGDKIQSGDAEYIRTPQGWIMHMCTGNASLISHRSRVQSYTFPVS